MKDTAQKADAAGTPTQPLSAVVNAVDLREALTTVRRVIERRNTIPIIGHVLLDFGSDEPNTLTLVATDLDMEIRTRVPLLEVEKPFRFTASPKSLAAIASATDKDVLVVFDGKQERASFDAGGFTMNLRTILPAVDFPIFTKDMQGGPITVCEADLHDALTAVRMSISTEETRYYLNGIYLHPVDGKLVAVATDGHRLSRFRLGVDWPDDLNAILPRRAVGILHAMLRRRGNAEIGIRRSVHGAGGLEFTVGDSVLISKLIDGTYPDYTRVIPTLASPPKISCSINLAGIQPFMGFLTERSGCLKISPSDGKISMVGPDGDEMTAPMGGEGPAFALNVRYLHSFLRAFGTLRIRGNGAGDPLLVAAEDGRSDFLIMPMRTP